MIPPRRAIPLLGLAFFVFFLYAVTGLSRQWRRRPQGIVPLSGLGAATTPISYGRWNISRPDERPSRKPYAPRPHYVPGIPKAPGSTYTKMLVVPRTSEEDTTWIELALPNWQSAVYEVDNPSASLHPPKNKGHEVMVYLTFIIDHYNKLPDLVAFMHSHQFAWHNDEIFAGNAVEILDRLNPARVIREGYMNLRCTWAPGCPDWLHPGTVEENESKQEETMLAKSWGEIFPDDPIPNVLAQPCCAQFAVSRERILSVPKARFVYYRDWLLRTELSDYISGRVWEYLWHVVFTGDNVVCPKENVCYCDGYGVCFGGEAEYDEFRKIGRQKQELEEELNRWYGQAEVIEVARLRGNLGETSDLAVPEPGLDLSLQEQIYEKQLLQDEILANATIRGEDPRARASEAGRPWKEGDGF
ncbi:hypothetical protein EYZ11_008875 [Aspergillus tanneri]|uniref:Uncharacterized protein n=1 Tax=Aspergillus tanneri TaxID=1220188 RepID=A0A4S3J9R8_9EURO|nr:uncharacterized protein ATNIH1004_011221 [Aspergillus tanneri]KAA8642280.1 hypothetical protein ATNIH1004_011221 [Aspergillus tanneri]THC91655.1 hypothetical protein EYZ11_008875 [Aspergillus tanneri]